MSWTNLKMLKMAKRPVNLIMKNSVKNHSSLNMSLIDRRYLTHPDTWGKQNQCKLCNKSFTERKSLNVHMIIHRSKKTHRCRLCGKSFAERSFNVHMLMHKVKKLKNVL